MRRQLDRLGVPSDAYDGIATSGDSARAAMLRGAVVPVVALVRPGFTLQPNPHEVDDVFEVQERVSREIVRALDITALGADYRPIGKLVDERAIVNAIVALKDRAALLRDAAEADAERASGRARGWLHGIPMAIKDLAAANIFPGDMLWKNFGVTRHGKVVFYDYDEIEYITDCNFRKVPEPRNEEEEMSGEVWYTVGPKDVFPETFGPFLLGNARVRQTFMKHHAGLLNADYWNLHKQRILAGAMLDVFPYEPQRRFVNQRQRAAAEPATAGP